MSSVRVASREPFFVQQLRFASARFRSVDLITREIFLRFGRLCAAADEWFRV